MKIMIGVQRDTDNTRAPDMEVTGYNGSICLKLDDPPRTIVVDASELASVIELFVRRG